MLKPRLSRFTAWILVVALFLAGLALEPQSPGQWMLLVIPGLLSLLGLWDVFQTRHAVLRNYPVIGHVRWIVELVRPEIRQYLLEEEDKPVPFSRAQRSLVYRRAKGVSSDHPFGTLLDPYARD